MLTLVINNLKRIIRMAASSSSGGCFLASAALAAAAGAGTFDRFCFLWPLFHHSTVFFIDSSILRHLLDGTRSARSDGQCLHYCSAAAAAVPAPELRCCYSCPTVHVVHEGRDGGQWNSKDGGGCCVVAAAVAAATGARAGACRPCCCCCCGSSSQKMKEVNQLHCRSSLLLQHWPTASLAREGNACLCWLADVFCGEIRDVCR
jgi:hypothetical protein